MEINWLIQIIAALVPMLVGFIWYNPKVFGNAWMKSAGLTEEQVKTGNMPLIFGLSFVLAFVLSFTYKFLGDHYSAFQAFFRPVIEHGLGVDPATPFGTELKGLIDGYGERYHSWTHGLAHSLIISFFVLLPIMGTGALFERKSFKYFMLNWGYWVVTLALMYMVLAHFG
jgi:hypothetical protein